ncbi:MULTISPECIES: hypothetical protein [unclassified Kribbella]|uniref:hypothetical protein n=1 Tax=unclassified Kribbella TaxID=2644121 RepID=UPI003019AE55
MIVIVPVPLIAGFGKLPMSPVSTVGPVLVIPAPARTTKLSAVPSGTGTAAAEAVPSVPSRPAAETANAAATASTLRRIRAPTGKDLDGFMRDSSHPSIKSPGPRVSTTGCAVHSALVKGGSAVTRTTDPSAGTREESGKDQIIIGSGTGPGPPPAENVFAPRSIDGGPKASVPPITIRNRF